VSEGTDLMALLEERCAQWVEKAVQDLTIAGYALLSCASGTRGV